jgi:hypothetical protein
MRSSQVCGCLVLHQTLEDLLRIEVQGHEPI